MLMRVFIGYWLGSCGGVCGRMFAACLVALGVSAAASGEPVRTDDAGGRGLDAPRETERFTFAVFGDSVPGASSGLSVVERAAETANQLGVRFVMTTGNMVQGDTSAGAWAERVGEYRRAMSALSSPWYPVAGPLDYAIRSLDDGARAAAYRDQFGPMYYAFDSGWVGVFVLSSGMLEAGHAGRERQLRWFEAELAGSDAEQVFVFVHEPMWRRDAEAWSGVHEILRADGRPTRVISGGTRYSRDDGPVNNVRYYSVAMTGAFAAGTHGYASSHSITLVDVTRRGHRLAVVPYDATASGDLFLSADADAVGALSGTGWASVEGFVQAGAEHGDGAGFEVVLENPTEKRFAFEIETMAPDGWALTRDGVSGRIEPGQTLRLPVLAESPALTGTRPSVEVVVTARYPVAGGGTQPVIRRLPVPVRPRGAEEAAGAKRGENGALALDGNGAVRVDLGATPWRMTAECWVKSDRPEGSAVLISRFASEMGFGVTWSRPGGVLPAGVLGTDRGVTRAVLAEPPEWGVWTHVALTYDGRVARLFVDGQLGAESEAAGDLLHAEMPLYIGAEPNGLGDPVSQFVGLIDEVRVSSVVRYEGAFTPERVFDADERTLLLLHFDTPLLGAHPDDSGRGNHGWQVGRVRIERAER